MGKKAWSFINKEDKSATTAAPTLATDGYAVGLPNTTGGSVEIWLFFNSAAGTGFVADVIPWVYVDTDPTVGDKRWIALGKLEGVPLDGSESTAANGGQVRLLDMPEVVVERVALEWTAVGAASRISIWAARS